MAVDIYSVAGYIAEVLGVGVGQPLNKKRGVVLHSGGLDSSVLLAVARLHTQRVLSLTVGYGQRHQREISYAEAFSRSIGVDHDYIDLSALGQVMEGSSQTDSRVAVPQGYYAEDNMEATVVPNRNMVLLSVAIARCVALRWDYVMIAAHAGDHPIYADCRPEFIKAMKVAASLCSNAGVTLVAPFTELTKADLVMMGSQFGVSFGTTYSCYEGGERHCGRCGTCVERILAFYKAGVADPTRYDILHPLADALVVQSKFQGK